jgi:hypothetical protein
MQRFSVEAIAALAKAALALAASPDAAALALESVGAALAAMDSLFAAERAAEGSEEWRGMYWADRHRFTNYQARRRQVLGLQAVLSSAQSSAPAGKKVIFTGLARIARPGPAFLPID